MTKEEFKAWAENATTTTAQQIAQTLGGPPRRGSALEALETGMKPKPKAAQQPSAPIAAKPTAKITTSKGADVWTEELLKSLQQHGAALDAGRLFDAYDEVPTTFSSPDACMYAT